MTAFTYFDLDVARQIGSVFTGDVSWTDSSAAVFGTGLDAEIFYDGDLVLDADVVGAGILRVDSAVRIEDHLGVGGNSPTSTQLILAAESSTAITTVFSGSVTHTGSGGSIRALSFTANASGTNASVVPLSFCISNHVSNNTAAGGTVTPGCTGFQGQGAFTTNAQTVGAAQTKNCTVTGLTGICSGDALAHSGTGGTLAFFRTSVRAQASGALSALTGGATDTNWAFRSEGDGQWSSNTKLILEGSATVKGDSYLIFNSATTDIDIFVDNTKVQTWDNDAIDYFVLQRQADNIETRFGTGEDVTTFYSGTVWAFNILQATTEIVWNDTGVDTDFRIEGDTLSHMFYMDASAATENIALLAAAAPNWQAMDRGLFIGDATTAPTGNPANGGFLYSEAGALKWRGSSGTVSTIAAS